MLALLVWEDSGGSFDDVMSPQWEEVKICRPFFNFYIGIVNSCDDEKSEKRDVEENF